MIRQRSPTGEWIGLAYRWWGTGMSRHVLGQFAAAVVDHADSSVALIQDSLGIRPLFYRTPRDGIAFSTSLVALVALLQPSALDLDYFADALARAIPRTERTPYPGIRRAWHGATIVWRAGRLEAGWPWTPTVEPAPRQATELELEAELRLRLSAAVGRTIPSAGRVWCELSGGLHSTSVLAVGLGRGDALEAFTFVEPRLDDGGDTAAAVAAATALQAPWHTIEAAKTLPFSNAPNDFRGEPGTEIYVARHAAYRDLLRQHGVKVVLTGVGET